MVKIDVLLVPAIVFATNDGDRPDLILRGNICLFISVPPARSSYIAFFCMAHLMPNNISDLKSTDDLLVNFIDLIL